MSGHNMLIAFVAVLIALPAAAHAAEDEAPHQDANGDFMFQHYPPRALAAGEQGKVGFRVELGDDGGISSCEVTKSSGYAGLDKETCEWLVRYAEFTPTKNNEGRTVRAAKIGFVNWKLPAGAAAAATPPAAANTQLAANDPNKVICRRQVKTGSLVGTTKQCMTRREWQRQADRTRQEIEPIQGQGFTNGTPPGGQ